MVTMFLMSFAKGSERNLYSPCRSSSLKSGTRTPPTRTFSILFLPRTAGMEVRSSVSFAHAAYPLVRHQLLTEHMHAVIDMKFTNSEGCVFNKILFINW